MAEGEAIYDRRDAHLDVLLCCTAKRVTTTPPLLCYHRKTISTTLTDACGKKTKHRSTCAHPPRVHVADSHEDIVPSRSFPDALDDVEQWLMRRGVDWEPVFSLAFLSRKVAVSADVDGGVVCSRPWPHARQWGAVSRAVALPRRSSEDVIRCGERAEQMSWRRKLRGQRCESASAQPRRTAVAPQAHHSEALAPSPHRSSSPAHLKIGTKP